MRAALYQANTGIDPLIGARALVEAVERAAGEGADMLFTPEMCEMLDRDRSRAAGQILPEDKDVALAAVQEAAAKHKLWVHLGSLALKGQDGEHRNINRAFVIDDHGTIRARYDKLHLFDIDLPDGQSIRESAAYAPGDQAVAVDTPWGRLGLAICYDMRFPDLFRSLSNAGATMLSVAGGLYRTDGQGALACAAARARDRGERLRHRRRADWPACGWADDIWPFAGRRSVGRDPVGHGRGVRRRGSRDRSRAPIRGSWPDTRVAASPRDRPSRGDAVIVFDLACPQAHVFEAWFGSSSDYEAQRERGLVSCPMCGASEIVKAVMAPNVGAKGNQVDAAMPMPRQTPGPAEMKTMLAALAKAQAKVLEGSEHVGARFADEARAIHDGDAPERAIHGQATVAEARSLAEEGVPVMPLPLPIVPPDLAN